jgi:hypothetical protein
MTKTTILDLEHIKFVGIEYKARPGKVRNYID